MTRSRRSPEPPPESFVDRCLGRSAPKLLREWGWTVHLIADHYPADAQDIPDDEWMAEGVRRGWKLLTQDVKILRQDAALELLGLHDGHAFALPDGQLSWQDKALRFHTHQPAIYRIARRSSYGFYTVTSVEVARRWPRTATRRPRRS